MSRTDDKIIVRVPEGMRPALQEIARQNRRSANAQIVLMLEHALRGAAAATGERFGDSPPAAALDEAALQGGPINQR